MDTKRHHPSPLELPAGTGVLLVGHGTKDERGRAEFMQMADMLRRCAGDVPVEACYLELADPDIRAGVDALVRRGIGRIVVAPVLLFAAAHAKRDIPSEVADAAGRHGGIFRAMAEPLDSHPAVLELSARRFREALASTADAASDTMLVMVARGTSDGEAVARVRAFTQRRLRLTPVAQSETCFLTAAEPTLDDALATAASQRHAQVVVQPHLLFHGRLVESVREHVGRVQSRRGGAAKRWYIAAHLGPEPPLVAALAERITQAVTAGQR